MSLIKRVATFKRLSQGLLSGEGQGEWVEAAAAAESLACAACEARNNVVVRMVVEWAAASTQQLVGAVGRGGKRGEFARDVLTSAPWWRMVREAVLSASAADPGWHLPQAVGLGLLQSSVQASCREYGSGSFETDSFGRVAAAAGEALCHEPSPLQTTLDAFGNAVEVAFETSPLSPLPASLQSSMLQRLSRLQKRSTNQRRVFADCCSRLHLLATVAQSPDPLVSGAAKMVMYGALFHEDHLLGYQSAHVELGAEDQEPPKNEDQSESRRKRQRVIQGRRTCYQSQLMDSLKQMDAEPASRLVLYQLLPKLLKTFIEATNEALKRQVAMEGVVVGGSKRLAGSAKQTAAVHERQFGFWAWLAELVAPALRPDANESGEERASACLESALKMLGLLLEHGVYVASEEKGGKHLKALQSHVEVIVAAGEAGGTAPGSAVLSALLTCTRLNHMLIHHRLSRVMLLLYSNFAAGGQAEDLLQLILTTYSRLRQVRFLVEAAILAGSGVGAHMAQCSLASPSASASWREALRSVPQGQFRELWNSLADLTRQHCLENEAASSSIAPQLLTLCASSVLITTRNANSVSSLVEDFTTGSVEPFLSKAFERLVHLGHSKKRAAELAQLSPFLLLYAALLELDSRCLFWGIDRNEGEGRRRRAHQLSSWIEKLHSWTRANSICTVEVRQSLQLLALQRLQTLQAQIVDRDGDDSTLQGEAQRLAHFSGGSKDGLGWKSIVPHISAWAEFCSPEDASRFVHWLVTEAAREAGRLSAAGETRSEGADGKFALQLLADASLYEVQPVAAAIFPQLLQVAQVSLRSSWNCAKVASEEQVPLSPQQACCALVLAGQLPGDAVDRTCAVEGLKQLLALDLELSSGPFTMTHTKEEQDRAHLVAYSIRHACSSIVSWLPHGELWSLPEQVVLFERICYSSPIYSEGKGQLLGLGDVSANLARFLAQQCMLSGEEGMLGVTKVIRALGNQPAELCILQSISTACLTLLDVGHDEASLPLQAIWQAARGATAEMKEDPRAESARIELVGSIIRLGNAAASLHTGRVWQTWVTSTLKRDLESMDDVGFEEEACAIAILSMLCNVCTSLTTLPEGSFDALASLCLRLSPMLLDRKQQQQQTSRTVPLLSTAFALLTINGSQADLSGLLATLLQMIESPPVRASTLHWLQIFLGAGRGEAFDAAVAEVVQSLAMALARVATNAAVEQPGDDVVAAALKALETLLSRRAYPGMSPRHVGCILGALEPVVRQSGELWRPAVAAAGIASALLRHYPRRLYSSMPTLVSLCGSLLRMCMRPISRGARRNVENEEAIAKALARVLSALRPHRSIAQRYAPPLLAQWLACREDGGKASKGSTDAAYMLIDLCTQRELAQVPRLVRPAGSELFKALHADYLKAHKFTGDV